MLAFGLILGVLGLGTLFAMVIDLLSTSLWLALLAYAASFSGVFLAGFELAARRRKGRSEE